MRIAAKSMISEDAEMIVEVNGEVNPLHENGKHLTDLVDADSSLLEGHVAGTSKSGASCEDHISVIKVITGPTKMARKKTTHLVRS